jgi:hypothetical protein
MEVRIRRLDEHRGAERGLPHRAQRLHERPRCAQLGDLADGRSFAGHLVPDAAEVAVRLCHRGVGVAAFIVVATPYGHLPGFADSTPAAAVIVIHEALHFAGLPESPQTPGAMSPAEINEMVADRCGL